MSPAQREQRVRIARAQDELNAALLDHRSSSLHSRSEAGCVVCGTVSGWQCGPSPDGRCHYFTERGSTTTVILTDGTTVELPKPVERDQQTEDECLFCGDPEERK